MNSGVQEFNSPDYLEVQDYPNFPLEVNDEVFRDYVSPVEPENPTDIVSETNILRQEPSLDLNDQISSATEESEVIVNQQSLDVEPESVEPSPSGELSSQQEFVEEVPQGPQEVPQGPLICTLDMFLCWDGSDCLENTAVCDGFQHCIDASDEHNCTTPIGE